MSSWKRVKLSEVAEIIGGGTPKSNVSEYFDNGQIAWITPKDLSGYKSRYISKGERNITELGLENSSAKLLPIGTVLLTSRAPIGYVAIAKNEVSTNQGFKSLVLKEGNIPEFFYYLLKNNINLLEARASGSTFKEISGQVLKDTELYIPTYEIQRHIVNILSPLDEKIELNTQTNQTLEQIAQAIFKSWFVDFDPVKAKVDILANGGSQADAERAAMQVISGKTDAELTQMQQTEPDAYKTLEKTTALFPSEMVESELGSVPKGWVIGCIGDIATAKGGYAFKSSQFESKGNPVIKIKNITSAGNIILEDCQCINDQVANVASKFKLSDGDFLMAMTGATVGKIGIYVSDGRCAFVNQRVAKFESKLFNNIPCWYTYNLIRRPDISEKIIGSAQGSAQAN
ncbi:TPA: restriction endonuclease subunit S, partial [Pasteurella multocida]|nr:restriction endonuclease subunit S [Pasteurella multocida]